MQLEKHKITRRHHTHIIALSASTSEMISFSAFRLFSLLKSTNKTSQCAKQTFTNTSIFIYNFFTEKKFRFLKTLDVIIIIMSIESFLGASVMSKTRLTKAYQYQCLTAK